MRFLLFLSALLAGLTGSAFGASELRQGRQVAAIEQGIENARDVAVAAYRAVLPVAARSRFSAILTMPALSAPDFRTVARLVCERRLE